MSLLNFWFSHIHVSCKCRIQTGQVSAKAGPLMNGRMNSSRWTWRPRTLSFRMAMIEDLPEYREWVKGAVWRKSGKVRLSQGSDFWSAGRPKCINHLYAMGGWAVHANSFALSRPWQGCGKRKPTTESQTQIFGQCQSPIALIESSEKYTKQIEKFQTHKCSNLLSLNCNVRWDDKEAWARRCIANGVCMIRD